MMLRSVVLGAVSLLAAGGVAAAAAKFEEERGRDPAAVRFVWRGPGATVAVGGTEIAVSIRDAGEAPAHVTLRFLGANEGARVRGLGRLPGASNYYLGSDHRAWRTGVPGYATVAIESLYPGINVHVGESGGAIEYDLLVAPGANPRQVRLAFEGACPLAVDPGGALILPTATGLIGQARPFAYQVGREGAIRPVEAGYVLDADGLVSIRLGSHDPALPLVIDPVLSFSTYFGGDGIDEVRGIATDAAGNIYLTGRTTSTDFPTRDAEDPDLGWEDAFVTKLDPTGTAIVYSTYLGGPDRDLALGLAVEATGSVYVAGQAGADFPLKDAFQTVYGAEGDAFAVKLDPAGRLVYSTYVGGASRDFAQAIAVDSLGQALVTGVTFSEDFPLQNAHQSQHAGQGDVFVSKLDPSGSTLVYSTFLGGFNLIPLQYNDEPAAIAVDAAGDAYVTGNTDSPDFPVRNACQPGFGGVLDAFLARFAADGALVFSTYLGGPGYDRGQGIAVNGSGEIFTAGRADAGFPLVNPYDSTADSGEAFLARFDPSGGTLLSSTYLGGTGGEAASAVALDSTGRPVITGLTRATDFPLLDPFQPAFAGRFIDGFVAVFDASGSDLVFSSYLGGSGDEFPNTIAVDLQDRILVAGTTSSTDFPTLSAFQPAPAMPIESFITHICATAGAPLGPVGNTLTLVRSLPADIHLQWTDVAGASHYNAYLDTTKDGTFATPFASSPDGTTGVLRTPPPDPLVLFRAAAAAACAEGPR